VEYAYTCKVVAPARIARTLIEQRIKTHRGYALLLARESRAGNLVAVVLVSGMRRCVICRALARMCRRRVWVHISK
jgi:hypothetical protein